MHLAWEQSHCDDNNLCLTIIYQSDGIRYVFVNIFLCPFPVSNAVVYVHGHQARHKETDRELFLMTDSWYDPFVMMIADPHCFLFPSFLSDLLREMVWGVWGPPVINDIYLTSDQKLKLNNYIIRSIIIIIIIIYQTLPSIWPVGVL